MKRHPLKILITGASSGIGEACAELFASAGASLLLCARSTEKLSALAERLRKQYAVEILTLTLDVRNYAAIQQAWLTLPTDWQEIDVLINNAGLALGLEKIYEGDVVDWDQMIDTNVKGLLYMTRQVLPTMVKKNHGHVINVGSISGHQVYPGGAVYCATKFAVKAITEGLKMDVHGTAIRVSAIDPGMVHTNFSRVRFKNDNKKADSFYENTQPLVAEDIAQAIFYCVNAPAHVNVTEMLIYPTVQSSVQMIYRDEVKK